MIVLVKSKRKKVKYIFLYINPCFKQTIIVKVFMDNNQIFKKICNSTFKSYFVLSTVCCYIIVGGDLKL